MISDEVTVEPPRPPLPPTNLIGRKLAVEQIGKQLLGHSGRLLTLVGPPGIGKTTLALAVADRLQPHYRDGVVFVPLAAITDRVLMALTIAAAIGDSGTSAKPPQIRLMEALRRKHMLLVLDNLEQISDAATLIAELVAECPALCMLATSRERLHLRAEQRYKVPPLALAPAVELFGHCAQKVDFDFRLTSHNQLALEAICQRLDCLPLALELCAAQIELFSPTQLLAQLQARPLDLLVDGAHDLPPQHRTLRAAIERSYALLTDAERQLFRSLGVFAGGFDWLAVETVSGWDQQTDAHSLLSTLHALIGKSLVRVETLPSGEQRFLLLETIREFALEQARVYGEEEEIYERHGSYFLTLAEDAELRVVNGEQKAWHAHLDREQDNLHVALRYYLATNGRAAIRLAAALGEFWYFRGYNNEGQNWLMQALAQNRGDLSYARGKALREAGRIALAQGDYVQATTLMEESLNLARQLGDKCELATSLNFRESVALHQLDLVNARSFLEQSLALGQEIGDNNRIATALCSLGLVAVYQEDYIKARSLLEESLSIHHRLGNIIGIEYVLTNLGYNELHQGNFDNAPEYFQKGIEIGLKQGDKEGVVWCLEGVSEIAGLSEEGSEYKVKSAHLLGAATALRKSLGTPLPPMDQKLYERTVAVIRTCLDDDTFAVSWAEGQGMMLEEAVAYALTTDQPNKRGPVQPACYLGNH